MSFTLERSWLRSARFCGGICWIRQLRSGAAEYQNSAQGIEGRLASVRAELLPPLSPSRTPRRADRHVDQPCRVPMCGETPSPKVTFVVHSKSGEYDE